MSTINPETPTKRSPSTAITTQKTWLVRSKQFADLQNLTSTVGRVATQQMSRASGNGRGHSSRGRGRDQA
jgi:hypothetical protein